MADQDTSLSNLYQRKACIHGLAVEVCCETLTLAGEVDRILEPFIVDALPGGFVTSGSIRPYVEREVLRHLSTKASRVPQIDPWLELFRDGERFWIIDERWGMCEINFLRGQWRSWVLDRPRAELLHQVEGAVLWPMAQLLRSRRLHLIPAVGVARGGWGVLILSSFDIAAEVEHLAQNGYRIVGQRWVAVREEDGRIELLHVPGVVQRTQEPRMRGWGAGSMANWMDLTKEVPGSHQFHAFCDAVVVVEPGRRSDPHLTELTVAESIEALRQMWPMLDIHPTRRSTQLRNKVAQMCRCEQVQLSRLRGDLLAVLESMRATLTMRPERPLGTGACRSSARFPGRACA